MTSPNPLGWQVVLADLSLILFITTAATVVTPNESTQPALNHSHRDKIFSSMTMTEDIGSWLTDYPRDPRERLWITIYYRRGDFADAVRRAKQTEKTASDAGQTPHITLEQAESNKTMAFFAFDTPPAKAERRAGEKLARGLQ